jgi:hypothetical protein
MSDSSDRANDQGPAGDEQQPGNVLGGTMDAPPIPSADTFARELIGGEEEADLPVVGTGEVDDEPELPTNVTYS